MDKRIFCFWLGDQPMSERRQKNLDFIPDVTGCKVTFITDENIGEYIKPDAPFHEGYQYLSGTTKCDYARAYFMHHYGGGYTDIKMIYSPWTSSFDDLDDPSIWVVGYQEVSQDGVAVLSKDKKELQEELYRNWKFLLGNGAFICRPNTPFTREWMEELNKAMDGYLPELKKNPARHPRDCLGVDSKFPIVWAGIAGCIFHPLCIKYLDHLSYTLFPPVFDYYL
jgi:hypothetical protein